MSDLPREKHRPRFKLMSKIAVGFLSVIVIIGLSSVLLIVSLKSAVSYDRSVEYRKLQITLDLIDHFRAERNVVDKLLRSSGPSDTATYGMFDRLYRDREESLRSIDQLDAAAVDSITRLHASYDTFGRSLLNGVGASADTAALRATEARIADELQAQLQALRDKYVAPVMRAQNALPQRMADAVEYAAIVLGLSIGLGGVLALIYARTLTRPIRALQAGTMKVGEGTYETVPVTSNDEVADLTVAFNLMSEKLRQLDEMRMQMMSEISHEMRTPLQVIKAGCYSIIHTKDGPELNQRQRDAVGMIHQATNRINQFVNSFLDIAKMEAGLMKFNFDTLSLVEVLTPLVQEAQLIAQSRQITLRSEIEDVGAIRVDKERLGQAFLNLLSNALKYTPAQGTIDVTVKRQETVPGVSGNGRGVVQIDVKDSGVGIPESDLAKLFEKFYQAKNTPLVNEKGSGLGLALVKHVAEAHGGKASVASVLGQGATFTIYLPL